MRYAFSCPEPDQSELQSRLDEYGDDVRKVLDDAEPLLRFSLEIERVNDAGEGPHRLGAPDVHADKERIIEVLLRFIDPDPVYRDRSFEWHLLRFAMLESAGLSDHRQTPVVPGAAAAFILEAARARLDELFVLSGAQLEWPRGFTPAVVGHVGRHQADVECVRMVAHNLARCAGVDAMRPFLPRAIGYAERVGLFEDAREGTWLNGQIGGRDEYAENQRLLQALRETRHAFNEAARNFVQESTPSELLELLTELLRLDPEAATRSTNGWRGGGDRFGSVDPRAIVRRLLTAERGRPLRVDTMEALATLAAGSAEARQLIGECLGDDGILTGLLGRPEVLQALVLPCPAILRIVLSEDSHTTYWTPPPALRAAFDGQEAFLAERVVADLSAYGRLVLGVLVNRPAGADLVRSALRAETKDLAGREIAWAADSATWVPASEFAEYAIRSGRLRILAASPRLEAFVRLNLSLDDRLREGPLEALVLELPELVKVLLAGRDLSVEGLTSEWTKLQALAAMGTESAFQQAQTLLFNSATFEAKRAHRLPMAWWARWRAQGLVSSEHVAEFLGAKFDRFEYADAPDVAAVLPSEFFETLLQLLEAPATSTEGFQSDLRVHESGPLRWAGAQLRVQAEPEPVLVARLKRLGLTLKFYDLVEVLTGLFLHVEPKESQALSARLLRRHLGQDEPRGPANGPPVEDPEPAWEVPSQAWSTSRSTEHPSASAEPDWKQLYKLALAMAELGPEAVSLLPERVRDPYAGVARLSNADLDLCFEGLEALLAEYMSGGSRHFWIGDLIHRTALIQLRGRLLAALGDLSAETQAQVLEHLGDRFPSRPTLEDALSASGVIEPDRQTAILDRCADERLPRVLRRSLASVLCGAECHLSAEGAPLTLAASCVEACFLAYANQPKVIARAIYETLKGAASKAEVRALCGALYALGDLRESLHGKVPLLLAGLGKDAAHDPKVRSTAETQKSLFDRENKKKGSERKAERRVQNAAASLRRGVRLAFRGASPPG